LDLNGSQVKVEVEAPEELHIVREELLLREELVE